MFKFKDKMPNERLVKMGKEDGETSHERMTGTMVDHLEILNNPNYIVKELRRSGSESMMKFKFGDNFSIDDIALQTQKFLDVIKSEKIDFIPKTKVISAKNNDGLETLYLLTKKIEGEAFTEEQRFDFSKLDKSEKDQLEQISDRLVDVFIQSYDKTTKKGLTIEFIKLLNYIKDKQGKLFLVDLTPVYDMNYSEFINWVIIFQQKLGFSNDSIFEKVMKIRDVFAGPVEHPYDLVLLKEMFKLDKS